MQDCSVIIPICVSSHPAGFEPPRGLQKRYLAGPRSPAGMIETPGSSRVKRVEQSHKGWLLLPWLVLPEQFHPPRDHFSLLLGTVVREAGGRGGVAGTAYWSGLGHARSKKGSMITDWFGLEGAVKGPCSEQGQTDVS